MESWVRSRILAQIGGLPQGVQAHIKQVRRVSVELAARHGLHEAKADLAAQAHDICRATSGGELLALARSFQIPVTPLEEAFPLFLHGPVGAALLCRDYGLDDPEILHAIACHTVGGEGMAPLDKLLFLADKLDPSKIGRYPFMEEVAQLARQSLDQALLSFIDHQVRVFISSGALVHPAMMAARNDVLLREKRQSRPPGQ